MSISKSKQKFALKKNKENVENIYEEYWKHETYIHGNEMRKRFMYTVKEIKEKYNIDSQQELIFLLLLHKKDYAGTCLYCKEDYFSYEIRSGKRSTYCGCKGICKECNKPYKFGSQKQKQTCSSCVWKKEDVENKAKQNENDHLIFVALRADQQGLMFYSTEKNVEWVVQIMKKRIKFLQSYLKFCKEDNE